MWSNCKSLSLLFLLFWVFGYSHTQLRSLYPLPTLDAAHMRKNIRLSLPAQLQCLRSRGGSLGTRLDWGKGLYSDTAHSRRSWHLTAVQLQCLRSRGRCRLRKRSTVITLIIRTIQLFEHPPFPGKMLNFCIPSIRTPTFEIIIPISEHLHPVELKRGSLNVC